MARECYYVSLKLLGRKDETPPAKSSWPSKLGKTEVPKAIMILSASAEEHKRPRLEPAADIIDVPLDNSCPERLARIENSLAPPIKDVIISLLQQYQDVFAFEPLEMPGIAPEVMQHRLNVDPSHKPITQKRRHLGADKSAAVAAEVKKLLRGRVHKRMPLS